MRLCSGSPGCNASLLLCLEKGLERAVSTFVILFSLRELWEVLWGLWGHKSKTNGRWAGSKVRFWSLCRFWVALSCLDVCVTGSRKGNNVVMVIHVRTDHKAFFFLQHNFEPSLNKAISKWGLSVARKLYFQYIWKILVFEGYSLETDGIFSEL